MFDIVKAMGPAPSLAQIQARIAQEKAVLLATVALDMATEFVASLAR